MKNQAQVQAPAQAPKITILDKKKSIQEVSESDTGSNHSIDRDGSRNEPIKDEKINLIEEWLSDFFQSITSHNILTTR
jgi:hypothetical protein